MRITITTLAFFFLLSCSQNISNDFDINKYVKLKYGSYDEEEDTINYVTFDLIESTDSIGKLITQQEERINYILANKIDFDALSKLFPDSTIIENRFKQQLNSDSVKSYIKQIVYPNLERDKKNFTENQIMLVASRFILVEKRGNRGFGARICYTKNGQEQIDDILLESVVMDAVRYNWRNAKPNPNINSIVNDYIKKSYLENQNIKSLDSLEPIIRDYVFNSMETDSNYEQMILNYLKENEDSLPFSITFKK